MGSSESPEQVLGDIVQPGGAFCAQRGAKVGNLVSFWGSLAAIWEPLASLFVQNSQLLKVCLSRLPRASFFDEFGKENGASGW